MTYNVGILIYPDVEVLDFAGPYEVFTTASRVAARDFACEPFNVFSVAQNKSAIRARAGLTVVPDYSFEDCPKIDILIIPGGVVEAEMNNPTVLEWIKNADQTSVITASVCTGVFLLAQANALHSACVTTHCEDIEDLKIKFPFLDVIENVRWIDELKTVTSAGISAGLDMCLHLVERTCDRKLAETTARQLEFDWSKKHKL